ncbi:MAG: FAD-dependent oxidoreductase, partial [Acidimicrobiia bacterium]|nr:FAD-dependent oxidoreductase [Acidimicrobiia bacterium]
MYDIAIIGGGPGGYAAALYAHNFGLSVALIEMDTVGGTCLLRGCIPAKSWLQAAEVYTTVKESAEFGVVVGEPAFDWGRALERKNKIVDGLVRGVSGLLKARSVDIIPGFGRLGGPGQVAVDIDGGTQN